VQQAEQRRAQRVADRPDLLGGGQLDRLFEVVVGDRAVACHDRIRLTSQFIPIIWIILPEASIRMAEVVLFHHAQGLTEGVQAFAADLRRAGHTVHVPDLYQGHVFDTLDDGLAYARETGFGTVHERGIAAPPTSATRWSTRASPWA
jgi:hypothetical protein